MHACRCNRALDGTTHPLSIAEAILMHAAAGDGERRVQLRTLRTSTAGKPSWWALLWRVSLLWQHETALQKRVGECSAIGLLGLCTRQLTTSETLATPAVTAAGVGTLSELHVQPGVPYCLLQLLGCYITVEGALLLCCFLRWFP